MRRFALFLCLAGAVALIAYGMFQPVEQDGRWILALWLAAPLLLLAARLALPALPRGVGRSLQNLGLAIALGFALLTV
ncbi:MAG TPA: penicillin-binding protein 2, partial [Roseiflexaceae bacterium]|nr:penicillin-binding protein 2 [Roseiflexaceae bacterium]